MAKKVSSRGSSAAPKLKKRTAKRPGGRRSAGSSRTRASSGSTAGEAFISLLQSPLVADLVAVAASSALAALAEGGFSRREGSGGKRAGTAVKKAGKAAAAAVGRRLSEEIDAIKKASKTAKSR